MSDSVPGPLARICYVSLDASNNITSYGHMPSSAAAMMSFMKVTEISQADFATISASSKPCSYVNGAVVQQEPVPVTPTPMPLSIVQAKALVTIDTAAEAAREQFLTPGSGQSMEYEQTQADAARALVDPQPLTAQAYPWLAAEQSALASVGDPPTLLQVAQIVQAQTDAWTAAGTQIKEIRRSAKLRVGVATTAEEISAILAGITWPSAPSS